MADIPHKTECGQWEVRGKVFQTNAEAWRYFDRMENEPISRSEDVADWVSRKMASNE